MVLRAHGRKAEDANDLRTWLTTLEGCPRVTDTLVLTCAQHGDERPTWNYVEADPAAGVARRRCLACGFAVSVLDSNARWTFPPMWSCGSCGHSIAEVAAGLSAPESDAVEWVVLGARCVECGDVEGLTDVVVPGLPLSEVVAAL
ncbi:MAG TPA: hypothetical protein VNU26_18755 [Mycobacteriales bacterium]|nr:hypothetical protein [Mycobacteriales bacterium]